MSLKRELLHKHTAKMDEIERLQYIKKLVASAISTRKQLNKALERELNTDPFNSSRASRTTAYANSWKSNQVYYQLIDDIKISMSII